MSPEDREAVYRGVSVTDKFGVGRKRRGAHEVDATETSGHEGPEDHIPTDDEEDPVLADMKQEDKEGHVPLFWMELHPKAGT